MYCLGFACCVPVFCCQVRGAASMTAEREARALAALEKSSAERAAALAAREKLLQEREDKVGAQHGVL